jgi:DNA-binding cell septation regulator SpoVG
MSRFKFEGDYAMRVMDGKGSLLAYFNVIDTEIGIEFRDCRLIEGKNGVFVGAPAREYESKDGETKYSDFWRVSFEDDARSEEGMAYVEEMAEAAFEYYESLLDEDEAPRKNKAKAKKKAAPKSKRPPVEEEDEDEDDADPYEDEDLDEDEDEEEEEEEEERPARRSKAAPKSKAKPARSGRGPVPKAGKKAPAAKGRRSKDDDSLPF